MGAPVLAAGSGPVAGHPLWHFAAVAGAGLVTFAGIKGWEWWQRRGRTLARPSWPMLVLSGLGLASSAIHAAVCPEHFREWVVYGLFFMAASAAQTAWSVLVLMRPTRPLLVAGAAGNVVVICLFLVSRIIGIPFGPEAFHPEELSLAGVAATASEVLLVVLAACVAHAQLTGATSRPLGRLGRPRWVPDGTAASTA